MGGTNYTVVSGDCLSAIAKRFGYQDYKTIYNHPDNSSFKQKRPNPNLIYPGDVIVIPDKEQKTAKVSVGSSATFTIKRQKQVLRLRMVNGNSEMSNMPYSLYIKGSGNTPDLVVDGKNTDGEGVLTEEIPTEYLEAGTAELVVEGMHFTIMLGGLDPIERVSGIKQRLENLGFSVSSGNQLDDVDVSSIVLFKKLYGLEVDTDTDEDFRKKLCEVHDNSKTIRDFED